MSQREVMFVLAHAQLCTICRERLLTTPQAIVAGRALTGAERELLSRLQALDFFTPERLAAVSGVSISDLNEYANHPVVRLRHL